MYQFISSIWQRSILSTLLQSRISQLHRSIALALEAEGFGQPYRNVEDNRRALVLLDHWKKGGDLLKGVPLVIDIGKRYEKWRFSALAIDVYDDSINIIAKQDNLSDESTDQLIAGG